jgi:hypothetical protein
MDRLRLSTLARGLAAVATAGVALLFVGAGASTAIAASTPTTKSTATAKATPTPKAAATPKATPTPKAAPAPKATPTPKATTPVSKVPSPVTCGNSGKSGKDKDDEDEDSDKDSDKDSEDDDSDVKDAAVVTCPVPVALPVPAAPAPVAAAPPATSGGVAGVTAAKAVATPKTGAELPLGGAVVLVALGGGALVAGRRLARGARI